MKMECYLADSFPHLVQCTDFPFHSYYCTVLYATVLYCMLLYSIQLYELFIQT